MEALTKEDLKKYQANLEAQAGELQTQLTEVRGAIRWLKQTIERMK